VKLPNAGNTVVDIAKLRNYCLSRDHPRGKHKAKVFFARLGLSATDAEFLQDALLRAALFQEAEFGEKDDFGQRYVLDIEMTTSAGTATVRSAWIVRVNEDFARFVTCYVM
jgi:hypothetical protein